MKTGTITAVADKTVNTSATSLLAAPTSNQKRLYLLVQNNGSTTISESFYTFLVETSAKTLLPLT